MSQLLPEDDDFAREYNKRMHQRFIDVVFLADEDNVEMILSSPAASYEAPPPPE